jgi:hypothetical protein
MPASPAPAIPTDADPNTPVRLHVTPLNPDLLHVYLPPALLPLARNISYHSIPTFPEKGYGYLDLPSADAKKLRNKLNGLTLRGSKVRIEMAKPEKRKVRADADADAQPSHSDSDRPSKRAKKDKKDKRDSKDKTKKDKKQDPAVIQGIELPDDRKVKRGWTEPVSVKSKKEKKDKKDKKDKTDKHQQRASKYTKEPELLFKAKLTPVAATEVARKEKKKDKKEKKDKKKSKEVIIHEFERNTKTPSFLKDTKVSTEKKPPVEYINGQGWVDEDGNVVEPETGKARNSRLLQLVEQPTEQDKANAAPPPPQAAPPVEAPKKSKKVKKATPPPSSSSESEAESSVVSSSSEDMSSADEDSESDDEEQQEEQKDASSPAQSVTTHEVSQVTSSTPEKKEVHPLEALFKRAPASASTPTKLTPINTSFSFFDNDTGMEIDVDESGNAPATPFTQKDLEWRGLRSAAPTPDTAAIGRRFSFDWRKGSHEADDDEGEMSDLEAEQQLSNNTKANSQHLPGVAEEDDEGDEAEEQQGETEGKPESEFRKWFWENRGDINRAWKKRRREALKAKRHTENRKMTGGRRVG